MKNSIFPSTGDSISRLGFGAMGLGGAFGSYNENELISSVLHSLDKGVNLIDTARGYGASEDIVGKALKQWKGDRPFIASKIRPRGAGSTWGMPAPVEACFPKGCVTSDIDESLQLLGVESIDLMQMHQYWPGWEKTDYWMEELLRAKEAGKIRAIGISINDHRHDTALTLVQSGAIDSVQTILNIFDPLALDCLLPLCEQHGVAFIARCVLDEGGLTGFLTESTTFAENDFRKTFFENVPRSQYIEKVNRLLPYLDEETRTLAQLAIKFVLHSPAVTSALVSMHIPAHADDNLQVLQTSPLSDEVFHALRTKHRWIRNFYDTKYW
ncbi:aldo/keto reductase [Paenibacillus sp. LjRoot56]|uniref:aldo/keto reductase n=1 Tax=Paenibacillus sp. LjRoot56 TaxID=3342333 RepID=UPI003ECC8D8A